MPSSLVVSINLGGPWGLYFQEKDVPRLADVGAGIASHPHGGSR